MFISNGGKIILNWKTIVLNKVMNVKCETHSNNSLMCFSSLLFVHAPVTPYLTFFILFNTSIKWHNWNVHETNDNLTFMNL